jgi:antitoxin HicB
MRSFRHHVLRLRTARGVQERRRKSSHIRLYFGDRLTVGAVYLAVREAGISNSEFARRMKLDEKEARRILDPHHPTKLARIEAALSVLGRHIELSLA